MEINPIETAGLLENVSKGGGPLVSFLVFEHILLISAIVGLWKRLMKVGDDQTKIQTDSIVSLNNNTNALEAVGDKMDAVVRQVERLTEKVMK